jgi:glycosyltransferase involved in cell wall biosynthesis
MDSVVAQTLKEIEVFCVDAGSTDETLEILREYEQKDRRIHVILSDKKSVGYQYTLALLLPAGSMLAWWKQMTGLSRKHLNAYTRLPIRKK